jgi:hypothetical protein
MTLISISSCELRNAEDTGTGEVEFSINLPDETDQAKSGTTDSTVIVSYQLLVSVEDLDGNEVLNDKLIPIYRFGAGFVSDNIKLSTGDFKLTRFMVINPAGTVIYAAPIIDAPLAYLVNNPLPLGFKISANNLTSIKPEVLKVENYTPDQFGYVNFGMQVIMPLHFYAVCILDNPLIMAPTRLTQARLSVFSNNSDWHFTFKLEAKVNHLVIRGGSENYSFILEKEGFLTQKFVFTARELKATSGDNPLVLKIPWGNNYYKKLILQPGPDRGKDAMISNLQPETNFGDHKYFEATFLSEPILTVMRSNRSLIWFNMSQLPDTASIKKVYLRLSFEFPIPWDSTVFITDPALSTNDILWYGAVLQKVIEPWDEKEVTWKKQPESIAENQVYVSPFVRNVNFIDIDVTRLFVPVDNTSLTPNYGMLFKLYPSEVFPGFRFASSDYEKEIMRPRLTIYYTD